MPPRSAISISAILFIVTIVALFEASSALTLSKFVLVVAAALAAGIAFVSARTGLFVFIALFVNVVVINWFCELAGTVPLSLLAELCAIAAAGILYGQIALAWRDARSPRRKAHEAAEVAMIDGVYRYLVSAAFSVGAFLVSDVAGLWADGSDAARHLTLLAIFGLVVSAPLMTAISAAFGRE